jgi:DNA-directed RNA polymerase subunit RPC12/RpoP
MREIAEPKSSVLSDSLVTGHIDGHGVLHRDFVVREMTGVEEDLLAAKGPLVPRLNQIIANCTVSLGGYMDSGSIRGVIDQLSATDRMAMLLAIRCVTFGEVYQMRIKCPHCSKLSDAAVNLATLERQSAPDPSKVRFEDTLPSGAIVRWHVMKGHDETWLNEVRSKLKSESTMTLTLLTRVDSVGDTVLNRETGLQSAIDCVKRLSANDRNTLRNRFSACEGKLDTEIEYQCPHCSTEFSGQLDVAQTSFFFPQGTSTD